jgi:nucleoside-diphosphate-sugar epimerase
MKILLIGSEGYIGSYLKYSLSKKYNFDLIDINWFNDNKDPKDFKYLSADYINSFSAVILLAAHSSVKMCDNNRTSSFNNNVKNFIEILDKIKIKFIYASSASVYGNTNGMTVDEEYNKYMPAAYYDITKQIIDVYSLKSEVEFYGLRFGTVNGWSPHLRKDIMINSMVYNSIKNKKIDLYCKMTNRSILGINDLSRSIDVILSCKSDHRGVYNLASFNSTSENIAKVVSEIMGVPIVEKENYINNYDFSMNTDKFNKTFNFNFLETVESITNSIKNNINSCVISERNTPIKYV